MPVDKRIASARERVNRDNTKGTGEVKTFGTPQTSHRPIDDRNSRCETTRGGNLQAQTGSGGGTTTGVCNIDIHASGTGRIVGHGGVCEQRNECGFFNMTMGPSGTSTGGTDMFSGGSHSSSVSKSQTSTSTRSGGSDPTSKASDPGRATGKNIFGTSVSYTLSGSLGFACGAKCGIAAEEVTLQGGNSLKLSALGVGQASMQGNFGVSSGGTLDMAGWGAVLSGGLYTTVAALGSDLGLKAGGNMIAKGSKIYLNSMEPKTPSQVKAITSTPGQASTGEFRVIAPS